jgi:hypothetical protein
MAVFEPLLIVCVVQIVTLTKKNRMLAQKCKENVREHTLLCKNVTTTEGELRLSQVTEKATSSSSQQTKVSSTLSILFFVMEVVINLGFGIAIGK